MSDVKRYRLGYGRKGKRGLLEDEFGALCLCTDYEKLEQQLAKAEDELDKHREDQSYFLSRILRMKELLDAKEYHMLAAKLLADIAALTPQEE